MARKRMIDPSIWADDSFGSLSRDAQLIYIGMISNADDEGILPGNALFLLSTILPYESASKEHAMKIRTELLTKMKSIILYTIDDKEYIQFKKWKFYQKVDKPQQSKYPSFDDCSTIDRELVPPNRIEQNRIEKNRREGNNPHSLIGILDDFEFLEELRVNFPNHDIKEEVEKMKDWCAANGKTKKDYKAFARNWLRKADPVLNKKNGGVMVIRE